MRRKDKNWSKGKKDKEKNERGKEEKGRVERSGKDKKREGRKGKEGNAKRVSVRKERTGMKTIGREDKGRQ